MKREELYHRTVDILVDAYFKDLLIYTNSCACAIGNMVAAARGYKIKDNEHLGIKKWIDKRGKEVFPLWTNVHCAGSYCPHPTPESFEQIYCTGYMPNETIEIERAFARGTAIASVEGGDVNFNGLVEIIKVLDEIHGNTDEEVTKKAKSRFKKELV